MNRIYGKMNIKHAHAAPGRCPLCSVSHIYMTADGTCLRELASHPKVKVNVHNKFPVAVVIFRLKGYKYNLASKVHISPQQNVSRTVWNF